MNHTNTLQQFFAKEYSGHSALPGHRHSGMVFRQSRPGSRRTGLLHPDRHDRYSIFKEKRFV